MFDGFAQVFCGGVYGCCCGNGAPTGIVGCTGALAPGYTDVGGCGGGVAFGGVYGLFGFITVMFMIPVSGWILNTVKL